MAWTTTKTAQYAAGGVYVQNWKLTADSAGTDLYTGLKHVLHVSQAYGSAATASRIKVTLNSLAAGTAALGALSIASAASGDDIYLTVVGN